MKTETWICKNGKWIKATKFYLFRRRIFHWITKWKLIDSSKYRLIPVDEMKKWFGMSDKEYEESKKLYDEKGTLSYEFYPCGGIGWGVKIHVEKTGEVIDITDVSTW